MVTQILYIYSKNTELRLAARCKALKRIGINRILEKYNLIKTFQTQLNTEQELFVAEMKKVTENGSSSTYLAFLDLLKFYDKRFIGTINDKNFKLRETISFKKGHTSNGSKVKAEYYNEGDTLRIKTQIQGMGIVPFILIAIIVLFYLLIMLISLLEILLMFFSSDSEHLTSSVLSGPIVLTLIVSFLTILPYHLAKRNVSQMRNQIEVLYQRIEKNALQQRV